VNGTLADAIGIFGSMIFIAAFIYANRAASMNKIWFNAANLVGAALLLVSLSVNFNLAAVVLELAWATIALWGLISAVRDQTPSGK
jgi:hypothetical protein